jgi:hypothetical protein
MLLQKKVMVVAFAILGWPSGQSQFIRRSVEGFVTDQRGNPISGAAVQMENTMDLRVRSFISQTDGHYYFDGLSDDIDYTLKARYFNYWSQPKTLSKFDSSLHAKANLVITIDGGLRSALSLTQSTQIGWISDRSAPNNARQNRASCVPYLATAANRSKHNDSTESLLSDRSLQSSKPKG